MATKKINQQNAKKKIKQRSLRKSSARDHLQNTSQMKVVESRNNCNRSKNIQLFRPVDTNLFQFQQPSIIGSILI